MVRALTSECFKGPQWGSKSHGIRLSPSKGHRRSQCISLSRSSLEIASEPHKGPCNPEPEQAELGTRAASKPILSRGGRGNDRGFRPRVLQGCCKGFKINNLELLQLPKPPKRNFNPVTGPRSWNLPRRCSAQLGLSSLAWAGCPPL